MALSSGEAEYYTVVKASAEALIAQAFAKDLGWELKITVHVGSSAAKAIASRIGLGRVRHLEVRFFCLREAVAKSKLELRKVLGKINPADLLTKILSLADVQGHLFPVPRSPVDRRLGRGGPSVIRRYVASIERLLQGGPMP